MHWQLGGNFEPVRVTCKINRQKCPRAIAEYIWSEAITDVLDYLTNDGIALQALLTSFVSIVLLLSIYSLMRRGKNLVTKLVPEKTVNQFGTNIDDLQLKINVLAYKMQYGSWPMRKHNQRVDENDCLPNAALALTDGNDRNDWMEFHGQIDPSSHQSIGCSLNQLCDWSSRNLESNSRWKTHTMNSVSDKSLEYPAQLKNVNKTSKSEDVHMYYRNSDYSTAETRKKNGKFVNTSYILNDLNDYRNNSEFLACEQFTKTLEECKSFLRELHEGNENLGLICSSSELSIASSSKDNAMDSMFAAAIEPNVTHNEYFYNVFKEPLQPLGKQMIVLKDVDSEDIGIGGRTSSSIESTIRKLQSSDFSDSYPTRIIPYEFVTRVPVPSSNQIEPKEPSNLETLCEVKRKLESLYNVLQSIEVHNEEIISENPIISPSENKIGNFGKKYYEIENMRSNLKKNYNANQRANNCTNTFVGSLNKNNTAEDIIVTRLKANTTTNAQYFFPPSNEENLIFLSSSLEYENPEEVIITEENGSVDKYALISNVHSISNNNPQSTSLGVIKEEQSDSNHSVKLSKTEVSEGSDNKKQNVKQEDNKILQLKATYLTIPYDTNQEMQEIYNIEDNSLLKAATSDLELRYLNSNSANVSDVNVIMMHSMKPSRTKEDNKEEIIENNKEELQRVITDEPARNVQKKNETTDELGLKRYPGICALLEQTVTDGSQEDKICNTANASELSSKCTEYPKDINSKYHTKTSDTHNAVDNNILGASHAVRLSTRLYSNDTSNLKLEYINQRQDEVNVGKKILNDYRRSMETLKSTTHTMDIDSQSKKSGNLTDEDIRFSKVLKEQNTSVSCNKVEETKPINLRESEGAEETDSQTVISDANTTSTGWVSYTPTHSSGDEEEPSIPNKERLTLRGNKSNIQSTKLMLRRDKNWRKENACKISQSSVPRKYETREKRDFDHTGSRLRCSSAEPNDRTQKRQIQRNGVQQERSRSEVTMNTKKILLRDSHLYCSMEEFGESSIRKLNAKSEFKDATSSPKVSSKSSIPILKRRLDTKRRVENGRTPRTLVSKSQDIAMFWDDNEAKENSNAAGEIIQVEGSLKRNVQGVEEMRTDQYKKDDEDEIRLRNSPKFFNHAKERETDNQDPCSKDQLTERCGDKRVLALGEKIEKCDTRKCMPLISAVEVNDIPKLYFLAIDQNQVENLVDNGSLAIRNSPLLNVIRISKNTEKGIRKISHIRNDTGSIPKQSNNDEYPSFIEILSKH